MEKIIIVYPASISNRAPRIDKLIKIFLSTNYHIELWYWERNKNLNLIQLENIRTKILLKGGGENNKFLLLGYLIWFLKVLYASILDNKNKFYCIGLISTLPITFLNKFKRINYIFDNNDNFSKSYNFPSKFKKIIERFEKYTVLNATFHIVPGITRWNGYSENLVVIRNSPLSNTIKESEEIAKKNNFSIGKVLTLYVNGWLTETRGIKVLLETLEKCNVKLNVLLAGKLVCKSAEKLSKLKNVKYLGILDQKNALAYYYASHLALTYYDPNLEINRLAEPNKWMDCIITSTPFIVNSEVETAKYFIDKKACFHVPFFDIDGLCSLFRKLDVERHIISNAREVLAMENVKCWDETMSLLLKKWNKGKKDY